MKTKLKRNKTRYSDVIEYRHMKLLEIKQLLGITDDDYHNMLFENGVTLLDDYFAGSLNSRFVRKLYNHMLKESDSGYWKFLSNLYEQEVIRFTHDSMPVYYSDKQEFGEKRANRMLFEHWMDFNSQFVHSTDVHERLRHFIIQNY